MARRAPSAGENAAKAQAEIAKRPSENRLGRQQNGVFRRYRKLFQSRQLLLQWPPAASGRLKPIPKETPCSRKASPSPNSTPSWPQPSPPKTNASRTTSS
ncbi:hypothetical protein [Kingella potus]|uniref:hypothetical protein n=1 Tax=Kingella potus TaxID=265175 RepID=UPI001FD2119C|nr:hypothetical protein [Kingella potus]UOP01211.1 hypothetical protein LVJ84_02645 [Kingella potus]